MVTKTNILGLLLFFLHIYLTLSSYQIVKQKFHVCKHVYIKSRCMIKIPIWQEIPVENFYAQISNVNVQNLKKKKFWIFFSFSAEKKVSISNGNDISWLLVSYSKSRLQPTSAAQSVPPVSIFCILNVLNFIFKHEFTLFIIWG